MRIRDWSSDVCSSDLTPERNAGGPALHSPAVCPYSAAQRVAAWCGRRERGECRVSLKLRLIVMNFLQFFIWGAWLLTIGAYWFQNKQWSGTAFGAIFSTMGIASLFMPALMGVVADKWINAEKLYGVLHIGGAVMLFMVPMVDDPHTMFWVMLLNMIFYMPTIALAITVAYNALKRDGHDVVSNYPPIRVWGTIGFIAALWTTSLLHMETTSGQFYVASARSEERRVGKGCVSKCRSW